MAAAEQDRALLCPKACGAEAAWVGATHVLAAASLAELLFLGDFVAVPLGPRRVLGVVWGAGTGDFPPEKLRVRPDPVCIAGQNGDCLAYDALP